MKLTVETPARTDPRTLGALCDNGCPLNGRIPVMPKTNHRAKLIVLGEGPGKTEEIVNEPYVGEVGQLHDRTTLKVGGARAATHITNTMMCRGTRKLTPAEWKKAVECCQPRLIRELQPIKSSTILAHGGRALQTLTGKAKIMEWMGAPLQATVEGFERFQLLPSLHPSYVLRGKPEWRPVLEIFTARAWALAHGTLKPWEWAEIVIGSSGKHLESALKRLQKAKKLGTDIETAGLDPKSDMLNLGFGSMALGLGVSIDWQNASDKVKKLGANILANKKIVKIFHNGQFDVIGLENQNV